MFTKKDLRNGDVIKKRNGNVEIVVLPLGTLVTKQHGHNLLEDIADDLTSAVDAKYDIVAVRRPTKPGDCSFTAFYDKSGELVYERKPIHTRNNGVKVKVKVIGCNGICTKCNKANKITSHSC